MKTKRKGKVPRRFRRIRFVALGVAGLFVLFFVAVAALYAFVRIPEPNEISRLQSVVVVDDAGHFIARIHAGADRVSVPFADMPVALRNAVVATEDRHFYSHHGVRITSIFRAALSNVFGGGSQGGSTITQQYVKNAFVGNAHSFFRKLKEAVLAVKLERKRSKDDILALYLNTIYFGRGAYGCEAAAEVYFGTHCKGLNVPQGALLAAMIRAPELTDPAIEPVAAKKRRDLVLGLMVRDGYLTRALADASTRVPVRARKRDAGVFAPHYLEDLRRFLESHIGPATLYAGGVRVRATLDVGMQRAAEAAVRSVYDRKTDPDAALVALDPATGAVRAMVGARDYSARELNLTRQPRQPGSTFKPIVLAAAVDQGVTVETKFPAPGTHVFNTAAGPWPVSTYDHRGYGNLTLRRATELSINTVYATLILGVGADKAAEMAHRLGMTATLDPVPSLTLGTSVVTPLDLASVYATLAASGEVHDPYEIEQVTDAKGHVLFTAEQTGARGVDASIADTVTDVLRGVITNGTGRSARIGRPAAGKTGTTQGYTDAWFAGYTPDLAAVVWNGFPEGGRKLVNIRGLRGVTGGSFPARMWKLFMERALRTVPPKPFAAPPVATSSATPAPTPTPQRSHSPSGTPKPVATTPVPTASATPKKTPTPTR